MARATDEEEDEPRFTRPSRTINLVVDKSKNMSLGFNIRGGSEFNLAIYVSGVTPDSLAEAAGFTVGDQIISVNGRSFENITHQDAVDFILSFSNLSVVVIATGKVPDEEQPFGKHVFITGSGEKIVEQYNNNGTVGGSSDAHGEYVIKVPPPPAQDEILNPTKLYETKPRDSGDLEESIVPVDQSENVLSQTASASTTVNVSDVSIDGNASLDDTAEEPPTEYLDQEDDGHSVEVEADAVVPLPAADASAASAPTITPATPEVSYAAEVETPVPAPAPSKTSMRIDLVSTTSDDIPSDEEALIALTPSDQAPPLPHVVSVSPQVVENVSEHRASVGSITSKKSGKSVESNGSVGKHKKKKKKKSSVNGGGSKFGSLKFGSLRTSKNQDKQIDVTETASFDPPPEPPANVLTEIDSNVVVSTTVQQQPQQPQQQQQHTTKSTTTTQSPVILHNTVTYSSHVMQQNAQNNSSSEVIAINRESPKQKKGKKSKNNGKGSIGSSSGKKDVVDSVHTVSSSNSSRSNESVMMSDTYQNRVINKEQERGSMIYQRDILVKEVHASLQEAFNEEDLATLKEAMILYHGHETVEDFLNRILPLFTPLKFKLLRTVRKIVYADEVIIYDGLVTSYLGRKKREFLSGGRPTTMKSMWAESVPIAKQPVSRPASSFGRSSVISEPESSVSSSPSPQVATSANRVVVTPTINTHQESDSTAPSYDQVMSETVETQQEPTDLVVVTPKTQYEASDAETMRRQTAVVVVADDADPSSDIPVVPSSPVDTATVTIISEQVVSESEDVEDDIAVAAPDAVEIGIAKQSSSSETQVSSESSVAVVAPSTRTSSVSSSGSKGSLKKQGRVGEVVPNKPYITVEKKITGERAGLVSVYTGNGDGTSETLVFQNPTYDNSLNTLTFNASLRLETPPPKVESETLILEKVGSCASVQNVESNEKETIVQETAFYPTEVQTKPTKQELGIEIETCASDIPISEPIEEKSISESKTIEITTNDSLISSSSNSSQTATVEVSNPTYDTQVTQVATSDESSHSAVLEIGNPTYDSVDAVTKPSTKVEATSNTEKNEIAPTTTTTTTTNEITVTYNHGDRSNSIDDTNVAPLEEITHRTCYIDKKHRLIGMTISGGSDSEYQSAIHVIKIVVNSAAYHAGIREGNVLISINDHSLLGVTHGEACRLIKTAFRDKSSNLMTVCVMEDPKP